MPGDRTLQKMTKNVDKALRYYPNPEEQAQDLLSIQSRLRDHYQIQRYYFPTSSTTSSSTTSSTSSTSMTSSTLKSGCWLEEWLLA
jgi:hypothetical protein